MCASNCMFTHTHTHTRHTHTHTHTHIHTHTHHSRRTERHMWLQFLSEATSVLFVIRASLNSDRRASVATRVKHRGGAANTSVVPMCAYGGCDCGDPGGGEHTYTYIHTYTRARVDPPPHTHTHTNTHAQTYIHTHTRARARFYLLSPPSFPLVLLACPQCMVSGRAAHGVECDVLCGFDPRARESTHGLRMIVQLATMQPVKKSKTPR
jgi:hypothetical protein